MESELQPPKNAQKRSRAEFEDGNLTQASPNGDLVQNDGKYILRSSSSTPLADF